MTKDPTPDIDADGPALFDLDGRIHSEAALRQLFNGAGARAPHILWSPAEAEINDPVVRDFGRRMRALADAGGRVPASAVTPDSLGALAGWAMILDAETPEGPFRYRHYGARIARHYGRDMTGLTTADFAGHIATFFTALYRAAAARDEWVLSEHEPPRDVFVRTWHRLIVPLHDTAGGVTGFAVANVPENALRAGLDLMVDPVFVLDDVQVVHYANRAAQTVFFPDRQIAAGDTLHGITGIALEIGMTPTELLAHGDQIDSIELFPRGAIVERLVTTVSATQHRGRAFYIVVMRLIGT